MATTVWCLVIDYRHTPVGTPFGVLLGNDTTYIADLKERVKEKKKPVLDHIAADQLTVWRPREPKLPLDAEMEDLKALTEAIDFLGRTNVVELLVTHTMESLELENEILLVQMPADESDDWQQILYKEVYEKAWGRSWPHHDGVIANTWDVDEDARMQIDDEPSPGSAGDETQTRWKYTCLDDIGALGDALRMSTSVLPKVVIRDEYEYVRLVMEQLPKRVVAGKPPSFVIMGQPGIGKTIFLLYLLLYRLERRLPTAIQLDKESYVVFHKAGVDVFGVGKHSHLLSSDCWALCDSNALVIEPAPAFQKSKVVIVQATSPRQDRWKEWSKQRRAKPIVMDLPHPFEIAAIALEAGFETANALIIMRTWGPVTRTIMEILQDPAQSVRQGELVRDAANKVANNPSITMAVNVDQLTSFASTLLFIRPVRDGNGIYSSHVLEIPTPTLAEIFTKARARLSNQHLHDLYTSLSSHSSTKAGGGWAFEQVMHVYMSRGVEPLDLLPSGRIQPTTHLLAGTLDGLQFETSDDFYWFPSVTNFPGIDAVLGNNGGIYALQATIAARHTSPIDGLRKAWDHIHPSARKKRWYFVVVTDDSAKAKHYLDTIDKGFTLGSKKVPVDVCTCVLSTKHRNIIL